MSTPINDGGPAFPESALDSREPGCHSGGMSLRDWFAGQVQVPEDMGWVAMALMGGPPPHWSSEGDYDQSLVCAQWWAGARARYRLMDADAMLKARNQ